MTTSAMKSSLSHKIVQLCGIGPKYILPISVKENQKGFMASFHYFAAQRFTGQRAEMLWTRELRQNVIAALSLRAPD